jgi:hypothetical protein
MAGRAVPNRLLVWLWLWVMMLAATITQLPRRVSKRRAAAHAGIDPRKLEEFIKEVGLPVYRAGPKTFRIDLDELDAAMRSYGSEAV